MADRYVNLEQVINNIDNGGLLVGNNAEWAKEAVNKAEYVDLNDFIPASEIEELINYLKARKTCEEYLANFGKVKLIEEIIETLSVLNRGE